MNNQISHRQYLDSDTYKSLYILAGYRRIAEVTKEQFARDIGVTPSLISQIESGRKEVSEKTLDGIIRIIASYFDYDSKRFAELLNEQAVRISLNTNQTHNNLVFIRCVHNITSGLMKIQKKELLEQI